MVAGAWTQVALVEEDKVFLMGLLNLQWSKWEEEEAGVEDLEKWKKMHTVRDTQTDPTRHRDLMALG